MDQDQLTILTDKYITGSATPAEMRQLKELLSDPAQLAQFELSLLESLEAARFGQEADEQVFHRIYAGIEAGITPAPRVRKLRTWIVAAAAIALLLASGGLYLLMQQHHPPTNIVLSDVPPGGDKATLTLADGSTVTLDSSDRQIAQGGATILQRQGRLQYAENAAAANQYNSIRTQRAGKYRLRLADGTEVWLNAASSLRFPVAFSERERKVELTGEAYFEVAPDATAPFKVIVNKETEVLVLGTSFNINAYTDEQRISTTLLTGKVKVSSGGRDVQLLPGQQALSAGGALEVRTTDTEKAIAWKNGLFDFRDATLAEVMRQLSRWYDIEIIYENGIPDMEFYGKMQRDIPLSAMLKMLERSGVTYRLEGNNRLVILTGK
ncbi:FecR family protein [Chitinophaga lutea]